MADRKLHAVLAAMAFLTACEAKVSTGDGSPDDGGAPAASSAVGKSEKGKLSIKAPGFDMKINIPKGISDRTDVNDDSQLIYPGAALAGMHIEAGAEAAGKRNSGVELRFTSSEPLDKVAAWYRDPARSTGFSIARIGREGAATIISGTQKSDGDPFSLRLSPAPHGGTEGRLTLTDAN
jgi:hypothetical protein